MKAENNEVKFAYLFDSAVKKAAAENFVDPHSPQIEILLVQTPLMSRSYQLYRDVIYVEAIQNTN
jgi:hypothetical protein